VVAAAIGDVPVTERERSRAFTLATLVVAGVVALLVWVVPKPEGEPEPRAERAPAEEPRRATIQDPAEVEAQTTPAAAEQHTHSHPAADEDLPFGADVPPQPSGAHAAAKRHALSFLDAFLRYEVGDLSPAVRSAIEERADRRLARALIDQPPRPPRGGAPPEARVVEVDGVEPAPGGGFDVIVLLERDGRRSPMVVTVERHGPRWLATAVG
jgi:hypothetical protein